jgi:uncharacterized protein (TIGR00661 family)
MRILYGVVGEGMGHAMRSQVILEHLVRRHDVRIVASGRAREHLARRFAGVKGIWGLTIAYRDNEVRELETVARNVRGAMSGWPANLREWARMAADFEPDVVVSDFESLAWLVARARRLPLISIDNMQIIDRGIVDPRLIAARRRDYWFARFIVRTKLSGAFHYIVSTFFTLPIRRPRTTLVPPILRPEILAARPEPGEHLLVYQTAEGNRRLPEALRDTGLPCRIYGFRRDLREEATDGPLSYRPFSEERFIEDLRTARAVVAGGGFTLMGECVHLGKPMLAIPLEGQFEQALNAHELGRLGYGVAAGAADARALAALIERLPECERALASYPRTGNEETLALVDDRLQAACGAPEAWTLAEAFR